MAETIQASLERTWLIELRKAAGPTGFTQQQVADETGLSRSFLSQIESGERGPSPANAKILGEFFGFEWTKFFE